MSDVDWESVWQKTRLPQMVAALCHNLKLDGTHIELEQLNVAIQIAHMDGLSIGYSTGAYEILHGPACNTPQPPTPVKVKVKMRVVAVGGYWSWEAFLSGYWIVRSADMVPHGWVTRQEPRGDGADWLAALSDQLGVRLEAEWEDEQEKS